MEAKKVYSPYELEPSVPIHPGEMLKDELQARGLSQRRFAGIIGVSYSVLNEILNGKRSVTTEYALKIEAATGIPAYMWLNMQSAYNMQTARRDSRQGGCRVVKECRGSIVSLPCWLYYAKSVAILRHQASGATTKIPAGGDTFRRDKFLEVRAKLGLAREDD